MKKLSKKELIERFEESIEDNERLLSENKYLNNRLERVRGQRDEANVRIERLQNTVSRLDGNLKSTQKKAEHWSKEANRLHGVIKDFSESALEVLNGH